MRISFDVEVISKLFVSASGVIGKGKFCIRFRKRIKCGAGLKFFNL